MRARIWILTVVLLLTALCGCAAAGGTGTVDHEASTARAPRYVGEYAERYPDEYASFVGGGTELEEDGLVHSHASLRYRVETDEKLKESGLACLSCKTGDFNDLYASYGMEVFNMSYPEAAGHVVEYWSCRTCHAGAAPTDGAGATLVTFTLPAVRLVAELDPESAACGQCHNALCDYARYLNGKDGRTLADLDPYRYGTDAEALRKATAEDGFAPMTDEATGDAIPYLGHPDIEIFQGSNHQQLGLTCASCHMPTETAADGTAFRNHNSSTSPLNNESAMRMCLDCHAGQGVADTVAMRSFVRQRQAELGTQEDELLAALDALQQRIAAALALGAAAPDPADLRAARAAYVDARYWYSFQRASAERPGGKVAHNPAAMRAYLADAQAKVDEANALLGY
ncbi:MAG: ammonia-forming cytochrome c nitrite reductase subunit c552 [Coriobacteriales bacterium]|jgi:nitrite reductase (cytochrome c-552)|nr:ammonia-forming cytochrome c nitrite reductase subunit c552 [Coriobacteriales bacterium]